MKNFEKDNNELSEKVKTLEHELNQIKEKKRQCQYPGCDSNGNYMSSKSTWHYSLESCQKWNEVNFLGIKSGK